MDVDSGMRAAQLRSSGQPAQCEERAAGSQERRGAAPHKRNHGEAEGSATASAAKTGRGGRSQGAALDLELEEFRIIREYVAAHPYPSYKQMRARLQKVTLVPAEALLAEYGHKNHKWCKEMYDTGFLDDQVNRRCGQAIADQGGKEAMMMNFYALMHASPMVEIRWANASQWQPPDRVRTVLLAVNRLQHVWDGIRDLHGQVWLD
mmetsp:Transcript_63315/g.180041  ORF Transcript_63315/g.180041 Transcript_63315/m.180041 type:complete len:206 (-) Transcript_63315:73-690(-)